MHRQLLLLAPLGGVKDVLDSLVGLDRTRKEDIHGLAGHVELLVILSALAAVIRVGDVMDLLHIARLHILLQYLAGGLAQDHDRIRLPAHVAHEGPVDLRMAAVMLDPVVKCKDDPDAVQLKPGDDPHAEEVVEKAHDLRLPVQLVLEPVEVGDPDLLRAADLKGGPKLHRLDPVHVKRALHDLDIWIPVRLKRGVN